MNTKFALALAALAVAASSAVRADDIDASQGVLKFEGSRTRAEVMAEAATVPKTRSTEVAGSRVMPVLKSDLDRQTVRNQAVQAVRAGQTRGGEIGGI
jgi:hypothetical protein